MLWQEHYRYDGVSFSMHPVKRHMALVCSTTGDVNFDHLVKAVSARFLPSDVSILPFGINKLFGGKIL